MSDQFFTPTEVAKILVAQFHRKETCIADFAAGEGGLLKAAIKRWPKSKIIATDSDKSIVRRLRNSQPSWNVGRCDFLSARSRRSSRILNNSVGKISLVLLNPPFSCRGGKHHLTSIEDAEIRCSQAMAFLLNAIPYVSDIGRIAAILPASSINSEKDSQAWSLLKEQFSVRVVNSFGMRTFDNCSARTTIVVLKRSKKQELTKTPPFKKVKTHICVRITRGVTQMHSAKNGLAGPDWPLVHTTNLRNSQVTPLVYSIRKLNRFVSGPAILLPRVGEPNKEKCVLYLRNRRVVLSDCIFAISCSSRKDAETVHARLVSSWDIVSAAYGGTCARYITTKNLQTILSQIGCNVQKIDAIGF